MGTILASAIIARVSASLNDTSNVHWPTTELLGFLNDGQRALVHLRPSANIAAISLALVAGTLQTLPATAAGLVDIPRNISGEVIRSIDKALLDSESPAWHAATANNVVQSYMYDPNVPDIFYVTPPQTGTPGSVTALVGVVPADIAAVGNVITLHDRWGPALVEYCLFRAYGKDNDTADVPKTERHYEKFTNLVSSGGG